MEAESANAQVDKRSLKVSWEDFEGYCQILTEKMGVRLDKFEKIHGIPVGGWFVARQIQDKLFPTPVPKVEDTFVVDDIVDSGRTLKPFHDAGFTTGALVVKEHAEVRPSFWVTEVPKDCWVWFPWERQKEIEDSVQRIIEYIGDDPMREGLRGTPERIVKSWGELYCGYGGDPKSVLHDGAQFLEHNDYDQIIVLRDIEFYSMCEHHMLPFFGKAHVGYLPDKAVAGVSKLVRMVEVFARRLQIQERFTQEIAEAVNEVLNPRGVGVVVEAQHFCMMSRGVKQADSKMITSALRGSFLESQNKDEFLRLLGRK